MPCCGTTQVSVYTRIRSIRDLGRVSQQKIVLRFSFLELFWYAEHIDFFRILLESSSMGQPQFVHLHVHTDYSLLDGAGETSDLLDEPSRQKTPAAAIPDHGTLFAAAT